MTATGDDLSRLMRDIAEKRDAERAERDRIAAERIERLRAAGMSDDQIRVACEVMQELLWANDANKSRRPRKRRGQPNSQGIA